MRNLTIKREKSFVGSLVKMKIYIEDLTSNEININNTPCRKIGELKNGEERTFLINEQAAKIFVIADKLSKNYCNEYYQLSEGQEDIFLSGKNKFNPANGNAFQFNNNQSEEIIKNRKCNTRKGLLILIIAAILGGIIGYTVSSNLFYDKTPETKKFSSNGITLELTDEFQEVDIQNYTIAYDSKDIAIFALKESFTLVEGFENYTLEQYADLVIKSNNLTSTEVENFDGLMHFNYTSTNPETNDTYKYFSYVYKAKDAFWLVQFATLNENAETYRNDITKWAKSVKFSN